MSLPNLPALHHWGHAWTRRHYVNARMHVVGPDTQMMCGAGRAVIGRTSGGYCPPCVKWLRQHTDEAQP